MSAIIQSPHSPALGDAGVTPTMGQIPSALYRQPNLIRLLEHEVLWYCDIPVMSPTVPLAFINDPMSHSNYQWQDSLIPNSGLHALRPGSYANSVFLTTENRFCELIMLLQSMEQNDDVIALSAWLHNELACLNHEKELQWIQQCGGCISRSGEIIVNTRV